MEVCWMGVDISQLSLRSLHMGQEFNKALKKETTTATRSNNKYNNILQQKMWVK
jgi:hypothetical protein